MASITKSSKVVWMVRRTVSEPTGEKRYQKK